MVIMMHAWVIFYVDKINVKVFFMVGGPIGGFPQMNVASILFQVSQNSNQNMYTDMPDKNDTPTQYTM